MSIWKQTGKQPAMLADAPRLPEGCAGLWEDFLDLHSSRGFTGFGPARITYADMHAWQQVKGVRLAAWQIDAIRRTDSAWLNMQAAQRNAK